MGKDKNIKTKCPYTNFKQKILDYIGILRTPREEFGGMAACPFVGPELDKGKLMIETFDPFKESLIEKIQQFDKTEYDSALFVQITEEELTANDTRAYQNFINKQMKKHGIVHLKAICFNPNDIHDVEGFNARSYAPYFLINIANAKVLAKTHKALLNSKYFNKFSKEYLDFLLVNVDSLTYPPYKKLLDGRTSGSKDLDN